MIDNCLQKISNIYITVVCKYHYRNELRQRFWCKIPIKTITVPNISRAMSGVNKFNIFLSN